MILRVFDNLKSHPGPSSDERRTCGGNQCPDSMHRYPSPGLGRQVKGGQIRYIECGFMGHLNDA